MKNVLVALIVTLVLLAVPRPTLAYNPDLGETDLPLYLTDRGPVIHEGVMLGHDLLVVWNKTELVVIDGENMVETRLCVYDDETNAMYYVGRVPNTEDEYLLMSIFLDDEGGMVLRLNDQDLATGEQIVYPVSGVAMATSCRCTGIGNTRPSGVTDTCSNTGCDRADSCGATLAATCTWVTIATPKPNPGPNRFQRWWRQIWM